MFLIFLLILPAASYPDMGEEKAETRQALLKQMRMEKFANLKPPDPGTLENSVIYVQRKRIVEKIFMGNLFYGFRPTMGGLETGSGLAGGAVYQNKTLIPGIHVTSNLRVSTKLYQKYDLAFDMPSLFDIEGFYAQIYGGYRLATQRDYYGLGADSSKSNRVNYLDENVEISGTVGKRWFHWLDTWLTAGYLSTYLASGKNTSIPSIEDLFDDETAPGLSQSPNLYYLRPGIQFDIRDFPGNPHAGTLLRFVTSIYRDRQFDTFSFTDFSFEFEQFIPFKKKYRMIAIRGKTAAVFVNREEGQEVPFFMFPYLGGSNSLRGYREYRFMDENFILLNVEYRWRAALPLEMALFLDLGKVFHNLEEYDASDLRYSYGLGFRFASYQKVFLRVDLGWAESATPRLWFKFEKIF